MIKDSDEIFIPRETVAESPHAINKPMVYLSLDGQIQHVEGQVIRTEERKVIIEYQAGTDARVTKTRIVAKELFENWQKQA